MPHVTLKITSNGLVVPVVIGLTGKDTSDRVSSGQPVPRPILLRGALDSGSNITAVAAPFLSQLGLGPAKQSTTHGVAGPHPVNLFEVSLSIPRVGTLQTSLLVLDYLEVMEWTSPPSTIDVLVGLDVLKNLLTILDGPRQEFTLAD